MAAQSTLFPDVITGELVPNPVVKVTPLRAYPGWAVRQYRNGKFDGTNGSALTRGCDTFQEVVVEVKSPAMQGREAVA